MVRSVFTGRKVVRRKHKKKKNDCCRTDNASDRNSKTNTYDGRVMKHKLYVSPPPLRLRSECVKRDEILSINPRGLLFYAQGRRSSVQFVTFYKKNPLQTFWIKNQNSPSNVYIKKKKNSTTNCVKSAVNVYPHGGRRCR